MAKLHFHYSTMNAGKSTLLLQAAHNYEERGMSVMLVTAEIDARAGAARPWLRVYDNGLNVSVCGRPEGRGKTSIAV